MKYLNTFITLFSMYINMGCDPHDGKLTLVNTSNDTVFYDFSYDSDSITYPITQVDGKDDYRKSYLLKPKSENHEPVMDTWEYFINEKCKDSTIRIFFFTKSLVETAGKDSIIKHQLYSKKNHLKVKDLEKLNWRVSYP